MFFFFKQKTAYEMRISDWSSDVCSSDLELYRAVAKRGTQKALCVRIGDGQDECSFCNEDRRRERHALVRQQARCIVSKTARKLQEIGRASCRERVCQYV